MGYSLYGVDSNPALVFLHGFLGNKTDWYNICKNLQSDYYCIALDLPGHGDSKIEYQNNSYSIEKTTKYIIDFLKLKKINNANLLGYSMGGRVAISLSINYPNFFNKIIIESGQPGIEHKKERIERQNHDNTLAKKIKDLPLTEFIKFWYDQPIFHSLKNHQNFKFLLNSRIKNDPRKLSKSLEEIGTGSQPSYWNQLYKINKPCLLIAGEYDLKYQKIFTRMHKKITKSEFVIIKNCGHNTHFENQIEFISVIKKFLKN